MGFLVSRVSYFSMVSWFHGIIAFICFTVFVFVFFLFFYFTGFLVSMLPWFYWCYGFNGFVVSQVFCKEVLLLSYFGNQTLHGYNFCAVFFSLALNYTNHHIGHFAVDIPRGAGE